MNPINTRAPQAASLILLVLGGSDFAFYPGGSRAGESKNANIKTFGAQDPPTSQPASSRRALPEAFPSPPFPSAEYQGYPLIGVPPSTTTYPLTDLIWSTSVGSALKDERIKIYGWINGSANWSTSKHSNMPTSYWIVPDNIQGDQFVFRVEREVDTAQTQSVDWGFRSSFLYGTDYRYMTAGGWTSDQLLERNQLYGLDATEQYLDIYIPKVEDGLVLRFGRWIACPDIETQFAPDNYMGSHSLLFTVDTYTQTGMMATLMLDKQWTVQAGIHAGTDMAPWYEGAVPTGMAGVRWVSEDNKDSVYLVLNAINNAKFQHFTVDGQPAGHDNFNYLVGTWQHKINDEIHVKTEGYYMWQRDAVVGGTPSIGPVHDFGGGGGIGKQIPGETHTYGSVNYVLFKVSEKDFLTVRNEVVRDEDGERYGVAGTYSSHAIGWTHNFNSLLQVRPELEFYRNWARPAFDLATDRNMWMLAIDVTIRF
ncbi:MAG: outer membrane beta-barrel protein [Planctomycetes bacterium]|nr:outer membrane beta-barrel protein [Planctomycetota bacterium]